MLKDCEPIISGVDADRFHRITTKETSVTIEPSSEMPISSVVVDELPDVVGDALVGVVGLIAFEPHAVMGAVAEPAAEIARRSASAAT